MDFISSNLGQFLIQTVFHSLIIAIVAESMISIWHISNPFIKIKFRLLPLSLPLLYLPLYFLVYPPRSDSHFHEQIALMDMNQWLRLDAGIAFWHLIAAILIITTFLFITKEAIPSIRHVLSKPLFFPQIEEGDFSKLDLALANLSKATGHTLPAIFLSPRNVPVIYSQGNKSLVLSASTIDILDVEELEAVIAHELAHLIRQGSVINRVFLVLRFLMFYNPVALIIFLYVISENEKICDDIAINLTDKRLALASGLLKVFSSTTTEPSVAFVANGRRNWLSPRVKTLKNRAYRELVKERVERMVHLEKDTDSRYQNLRLFVTASMLLVLLFFIV